VLIKGFPSQPFAYRVGRNIAWTSRTHSAFDALQSVWPHILDTLHGPLTELSRLGWLYDVVPLHALWEAGSPNPSVSPATSIARYEPALA
jgi:hypothetical protein